MVYFSLKFLTARPGPLRLLGHRGHTIYIQWPPQAEFGRGRGRFPRAERRGARRAYITSAPQICRKWQSARARCIFHQLRFYENQRQYFRRDGHENGRSREAAKSTPTSQPQRTCRLAVSPCDAQGRQEWRRARSRIWRAWFLETSLERHHDKRQNDDGSTCG